MLSEIKRRIRRNTAKYKRALVTNVFVAYFYVVIYKKKTFIFSLKLSTIFTQNAKFANTKIKNVA